MDKTTAMARLEALGTEQNRKTYARHGATENVFGVSYADLGKLQKEIKVDHELARDLWATGNHDARILATKVADPAALTAKDADAWIREDRKSTRLNSSHANISYAVFCLKKKIRKDVNERSNN